MPKLVLELVSMINRMPPSDHWKRLRLAVTQDELEAIRAYYFADTRAVTGNEVCAHAIRGVPLVIEDYPMTPAIRFEQGK